MSLREYRRKRVFEKTPEPKPKIKSKGEREALRFMVHKHNASHLHYDLRLEMEGVLKSWAVPKGPSLSPGDKRLAMMVEDHPYDYQYFEGVIPKGNYGAGEAIIWDRGVYCSTETADPVESEKKFRAGIKKGHLSFVLDGEKLKGVYDLVKLPENKQENSWLLIKRPDEFASTEDILKKNRSVESNKSIEDFKNIYPAGVDELLRDALKGNMPRSLEPMMAETVDQPFDRPGWIFEIKWDGYRAIAEIDEGSVRLYSRNDKTFNDYYPEIINDLKKITGQMVIDGEVVVLNQKGLSEFQLLQNYPEEKKGEIFYEVFDILYFNGYRLTSLPLFQRKKILKKILPPLPRIQYNDHINEQGIEFFNAGTEEGVEGVIAKNGGSAYRIGARSSDWLKIKKLLKQEAVIGGFTEPRGGRGFLGALMLGVYEGDDLIYIGHTGGGFSDKQLKELRTRLDKKLQKTSPFKEMPQANSESHWVRPELVCEVKFLEWTREGTMRQPIFLGFREDKPAKEVTFEPKEPVEQIFKTDAKEKKKINIDGRDLVISNPSKIYWPKEKYTKMDLVDYYQKIASYILPYIKNRPQSMLRHPNGITGESFFQKNVENPPDWIPTIGVGSDSEERTINYLICNDLPALIYMVNLGCIEINVWNSSLPSLDFPDYMVIDLDPENIDFKYVVEAAIVVKKILDGVKCPSWCKTSGKTGLHIYVPLGAKYDYDQTKNFCEILVRMAHAELRKTTSLVRSPGKRQEKVYLDFLQNRRGQTMSAPYSVRPVDGANVSTPLKWSEVKKDLKPGDFNIKNIFNRLSKTGDIWLPPDQKAVDIEKSLELLA